MKKFLKIFALFFIIIISIIIVNTIRNVCIMNKLKNNANKYFENMASYKITISSKYSTVNKETNKNLEGDYIQEIYSKDNKIIIKEIFCCEGLEPEENQRIENEDTFINSMKSDFILKELSIKEKLIFYLFNIIKFDNNCYIVKYNSDVTSYFNKETGMLEKLNSYIYHIEKNV